MKNDYVIELPELENAFNEQHLWLACQKNTYHVNEAYGVECFEVPHTQKEVKHIFDAINGKIMFKQPIGWYMHKFKNEYLKPHVDNERNAIIMFPIKPKNYTITFLDDLQKQNTVYEHRYTCPTIVNSNIPHCVYDQGIDRHFFQISLFIKDFNWNELKNLVSDGKFINS